jgi:hypothetical protein
LAAVLAKKDFSLVLTSPLERARETCELAGLGNRAAIDPNLMEWNYGEYEGLTPRQIHAQRPGWVIFTEGCPAGESAEQVGVLADRGDYKSSRDGRACRPFCPRSYFQSVCGPVAWITCRSGMPLSSQYGDVKHLELLPGYSGGEVLEYHARVVRK